MICAALHDVLVQPLAAQVEEAVLEPGFLRIFLIAEHRHRQFAGRPQHLDLGDVDLDRAGRQVGILGAGRAAAHLAVDPHHPFRAQRLGDLEGRAVGIGHHLGQAVMVAQIDEQHAAVVADAMAPAGQPHVLADVAVAERATGMGAVAVHGLDSVRMLMERRAKSACGVRFVKASRPSTGGPRSAHSPQCAKAQQEEASHARRRRPP